MIPDNMSANTPHHMNRLVSYRKSRSTLLWPSAMHPATGTTLSTKRGH